MIPRKEAARSINNRNTIKENTQIPPTQKPRSKSSK